MGDRRDIYAIADLLLAILAFTRPEFPLVQADLDLRERCYDLARERFQAHGFDPSRKTNDVLMEILFEAHAHEPDILAALCRFRDQVTNHKPS